MKIEEFKNVTMIYMRHVGEYGLKNKELMETFKQFLKDNHLLNDQSVILGIALDNPQIVPADQLRYDVGLIVDETENDILPSRLIDDGKYAIFEVPHTAQGVQDFWIQIPKLAENLSIDEKKPILERYAMNKSRIICVNSVFHLNNINCINKKDVLESIFSKIIQIIVKLCYNESVNKSS